jgi:hypothetical protein
MPYKKWKNLTHQNFAFCISIHSSSIESSMSASMFMTPKKRKLGSVSLNQIPVSPKSEIIQDENVPPKIPRKSEFEVAKSATQVRKPLQPISMNAMPTRTSIPESPFLDLIRAPTVPVRSGLAGSGMMEVGPIHCRYGKKFDLSKPRPHLVLMLRDHSAIVTASPAPRLAQETTEKAKRRSRSTQRRIDVEEYVPRARGRLSKVSRSRSLSRTREPAYVPYSSDFEFDSGSEASAIQHGSRSIFRAASRPNYRELSPKSFESGSVSGS